MFYTPLDGAERPGAMVAFTGSESAHLARSLRARPGDLVTAGDGRGLVCEVRLEAVDRSSVAGRVVRAERVPHEAPRITLFQALGKASKMDEAVASAVEAGVSAFVPFASERSPAGSLEKAAGRHERWRRIAVEASKVARRPWLMEMGGTLPRPPIGSELEAAGRAVLLWEGEGSSTVAEALPEGRPERLCFLVGPEGGFSEREARELENAGAVTASLGRLILRTQTAGIYAAMIARFRYGILSPGGAGGRGGARDD